MQPHPWFNPLYRRILTAAFCILWLGFEAHNDPGSMWTLIFTGISAWAIWDFFLAGRYPVEEE